jgi:hypothetical protein
MKKGTMKANHKNMKKEDLNLQIRAPLSQDLVEEGK